MLWVEDKQLPNEVLCIGAYGIPLRGRKLKLPLFYLIGVDKAGVKRNSSEHHVRPPNMHSFLGRGDQYHGKHLVLVLVIERRKAAQHHIRYDT